MASWVEEIVANCTGSDDFAPIIAGVCNSRGEIPSCSKAVHWSSHLIFT